MGANIAGIYGAQIFRADDRPLYQRGFATNIAIIVVAILLSTVRYVDDILRKKRADKLQAEQFAEAEDKAVQPSDIQPAPIVIGKDLKPLVSEAVPK
jgi:hypothetical protein